MERLEEVAKAVKGEVFVPKVRLDEKPTSKGTVGKAMAPPAESSTSEQAADSDSAKGQAAVGQVVSLDSASASEGMLTEPSLEQYKNNSDSASEHEEAGKATGEPGLVFDVPFVADPSERKA
jgi:hypothetical protein